MLPYLKEHLYLCLRTDVTWNIKSYKNSRGRIPSMLEYRSFGDVVGVGRGVFFKILRSIKTIYQRIFITRTSYWVYHDSKTLFQNQSCVESSNNPKRQDTFLQLVRLWSTLFCMNPKYNYTVIVLVVNGVGWRREIGSFQRFGCRSKTVLRKVRLISCKNDKGK